MSSLVWLVAQQTGCRASLIYCVSPRKCVSSCEAKKHAFLKTTEITSEKGENVSDCGLKVSSSAYIAEEDTVQ